MNSIQPRQKNKLLIFLKNADLYIAMGAFLFVTLATFTFFIARYVFSASIPELEELNIIVFIWFLYFSMIYSIRVNAHIRVNLIDICISKKSGVALTVFADVVLLLFNGAMAYFSAKLVYFNFDPFGAKSIMLGIPDYIVYAILPFSFSAFSIMVGIQIQRGISALRSANKV